MSVRRDADRAHRCCSNIPDHGADRTSSLRPSPRSITQSRPMQIVPISAGCHRRRAHAPPSPSGTRPVRASGSHSPLPSVPPVGPGDDRCVQRRPLHSHKPWTRLGQNVNRPRGHHLGWVGFPWRGPCNAERPTTSNRPIADGVRAAVWRKRKGEQWEKVSHTRGTLEVDEFTGGQDKATRRYSRSDLIDRPFAPCVAKLRRPAQSDSIGARERDCFWAAQFRCVLPPPGRRRARCDTALRPLAGVPSPAPA